MTEPEFETAMDEFARLAETASEQLGAAQPGDAAVIEAMVAGVLASPAAVATAGTSPATTGTSAATAGAAGAKGIWMIVGSLVLVGGLVAALVWGVRASRGAGDVDAPSTTSAAAVSAQPRPRQPATSADDTPVGPDSRRKMQPHDQPAPPSPEAGEVTKVSEAGEPGEGSTETDAAPPAAQPQPRKEVEPAPTRTAAQLLLEANRASRAGKRSQARKHYAALERHYPDSRERQVARVGWGELELSAKRPKRALAQFDAYLSDNPKGNLVEEALHGRARALDALGRREQGAKAWRELLDRFPSSAHARAAERRLE